MRPRCLPWLGSACGDILVAALLGLHSQLIMAMNIIWYPNPYGMMARSGTIQCTEVFDAQPSQRRATTNAGPPVQASGSRRYSGCFVGCFATIFWATLSYQKPKPLAIIDPANTRVWSAHNCLI